MNDRKKVALIQGGTLELVRDVASSLLAHGATVALYSPQCAEQSARVASELAAGGGEVLAISPSPSAQDGLRSVLQALQERCGAVDAVVNLHVPTVDMTEEALTDYPRALQACVFAAGNFMAEHGSQGIIINQFMLATMFVDHPLAVAAAAARGAVCGVTRTACVRFGKAGVRVAGLFVGLLDLPQIKALASARARAATTPLGRWITTADVAETVSFLALDSGYISGQILVLDGGMTTGINGL